MKQSEEVLIEILKHTLNGEPVTLPEDCTEVVFCAQRQKVLSLLYDALAGFLPQNLQMILDHDTRQCITQFWHLFFLTERLCRLFAENGIPVTVLKGISAAKEYPVMEYRKSGDVDLLILSKDLAEAERILLAEGFRKSQEQKALHHMSFFSPENIEIEVHTLLAEPFDNADANRKLEILSEETLIHSLTCSIEGTDFPMPDPVHQALSLLLHMLSHYLRAGFGLKLLTDWFCFWNVHACQETAEEYTDIVNTMGIGGFSDLVTSACVQYLGLREDAAPGNRMDEEICRQFIEEVFAGGEFGRDGKDRMVSLRSNSLLDYVREFHHQMHLNYPKAGNYIPAWPVLWGMTLIRFLHNNRTVRRTNTLKILKEAGRRSELNEQIHLFEIENDGMNSCKIRKKG